MDKHLRKKEIFKNIEIIDLGAKGKGIAKINNKVVFIDKTIPGDIVNIQIFGKKKGYFSANILDFVQLSQKRTKAVCNHFNLCGGCKIQNMKYSEQLLHKQKIVFDSLTRIGKVENPEILEIIGSEKTEFYRNKLDFSFSNKRWLTEKEIKEDKDFNRNGLGFHIPGRFDKIVDIEKCYLLAEPSNKIRNETRKYAIENNLSFYDTIATSGLLRNLVIRISSIGEIMVNVVFGENNIKEITNLLNHIVKSFPEITSVFYMINLKKNDSLYDIEPKHFSGSTHIKEKIEHIEILLGPKSFSQTNSFQAINLYNVVRDFANIKKTDIVYDLYSGVGSIGLFLAEKAKKIIGIETVDESVIEADINKANNNIKNATFHSGIVENILDDNFISDNGKADIIIVDPPRAGLHKKVIPVIKKSGAKKIIYVSCNPATQARDIELLSSDYTFIKSQPVDMFPHTLHVENVALLILKNN
ncbi:MAG: 23S rRNA (uracil(1939)-C(5))-methyltransferase RlmD [Bacteroidota bacterium]|nr:23S rRNA (uracil(1939)-C(5))-methyltransferase RlmD [Bacteroidota bacterium]